MFTMVEDNEVQNNGQAKFTVFGVGGGGGNAVEHMVQSGIRGVNFVCANTDKQALDSLSAPHILQLGESTNRGLGAGANPEIGRQAAEAEEDTIRQYLQGSDMVFITAGMGGGTGTGASPVVARIAKDMDILTVAVVTKPFKFEGRKREKIAAKGIDELSEFVDSIITIPNEKLMAVYGSMNFTDAFSKANDVLLQAVRGIAETITSPGMINIDFNDIRTAMTARGHAMMGMGKASGEDRARIATEMAIKSPLLDNISVDNAKGVLVNITSSSSFQMTEFNTISEVVGQITDYDSVDANIFYGSILDEDAGDEIRITVIATGLTQEPVNMDDSIRQRQSVSTTISKKVADDIKTTAPVSQDSRREKSGSGETISSYLVNQQTKPSSANTSVVEDEPQNPEIKKKKDKWFR